MSGIAASARSGNNSRLKMRCRLAQDLSRLAENQAESDKCEIKFNELEAQVRQTSELETRRLDLERQLDEQTSELRRCQDERERSQARIAARKLAVERHSHAERELQAALDEHRQRAEAAKRLVDVQNALRPGQEERRYLRADRPAVGGKASSAEDNPKRAT